LPLIKAVIFDFIGTLTDVKNYDLEASKTKLYEALREVGFNVSFENFLHAYSEAHEKYRVVRYERLVEVTNAVWISEALNDLGFKTTPEDLNIMKAVAVFFEDYLDSLSLRSCSLQLLQTANAEYKLGLISNFTYAPVIHETLRKLEISQFFNAVLISQEVGFRKPNAKIFEEAIRRLSINPKETVYVGDSPIEDIKGAKALSMKTIFTPSQFYSLEDLRVSRETPDLVVEDICGLNKNFKSILRELTQ
jgi:putative hydrolase of the HAD superfamily